MKKIFRYLKGLRYRRWFSRFYPANEEWFKEFVFSKTQKESERERFIRILNNYPEISDAFYRWTK